VVTPTRPFLHRSEIDAHVVHLFGLSRDGFAYILDTFPVFNKKKKAFGEFMPKKENGQ